MSQIDHTLRGTWTAAGGANAHLPPHALRWLRARIGLDTGTSRVPVGPDSAFRVPESALPAAARDALAAAVGAGHVLTDRAARLGRAGGLSYLDLLRHRGCGELAVPDAVVLPADPGEVQRVLEVCAEHDVGVVPFGGGTSVVGGVTALRGGKPAVVALDLVRLDRLVSVDPVSRVAVLQAGVRGPDAERLLAEHGFTLGHLPQSFERATIGGFAATRSAGQASSGYGRFEDMVEGVWLATPAGEWRLGVAPASAAGPDLRRLVLGSEGTLGVITEVALRVRPRPVVVRYEGIVLDGWEAGSAAVRELAQRHALADVTRLSDDAETEVSLALAGGWQGAAVRGYLAARRVAEPCLLVLGWDTASPWELAMRRAAAMRVLRRYGAVRLGRPAGEAWRRGRFAGPRQRDALLDAGVCVETLETATHWSRLSELRDAVRRALIGALAGPAGAPVVMCHVSHAYETGASLYFTVLVPRAEDDPIGQWQHAKAAACRAIAEHRDGPLGPAPLGTITHHHAVGVDHAPYLAGEIGPRGVEVLRAAKRALDPTGILNPGKLLPTR
ncbi:FAD-binding oxidoreductase [Gandjariella thermophila]|uniref:Alkyldihydroxyacetonephosphate synthase n=1 Tax=Gandjariella thermophila TaxID=1931992 RepID=A0A4D4J5X4_9PSEU|nr:FAD-binding oxidoreductase [Gandjariella thermophila]GDY30138.1 alkyldihydroxyacetonephosphate synthase [Gandjariella thermophila]